MDRPARLPPVRLLVVSVAAGAFVACTPGTGEEAGAPASELRIGQEEIGHYEPVENWPQPLPDDLHSHDGWTWGSMGSVYAESPDRIWVAMRGELPLPEGAEPWTPYGQLNPPRQATGADDTPGGPYPAGDRGWERRYLHVIYVLDSQGRVVDEWPQHDALFDHEGGRGPHKIKMSPHDPDRHVWVIDDLLHQIHKFTYDGELVMTLGERGVEGRGPNTFARPTDIAWLPDGTFFISDGYHGTRVAKFDADGNFLMEWGGPPADPANPGPNEWNTVHAVAVSRDRRVFVADRAHRRIQVFDENGNFLDMFTTGIRSSPYAILVTEDDHLWVADGGTQRIVKFDLDGNYLYGWGARGPRPGEFWGPHGISVDQDGNLYIAEVFNGRLQKFRPMEGADPGKIVGQEIRQN